MAPTLHRILLVEDEEDIRVIAKLSLENVGGFVVDVVSSGREAVARAIEFAPDLVLLDVMMPGMDGLATLKTLQEEPTTRAIPVVFMTAKVQSNEVSRYKERGALDVIRKPFDPMTLPKTIRDLWETGQKK